MEISSEKILNKMELLVQQAKRAQSTAEMNRYISSVQTLCELLVETDPMCESELLPSFEQVGKVSTQPVTMESAPGKMVKMDDANGTSLLDF